MKDLFKKILAIPMLTIKLWIVGLLFILDLYNLLYIKYVVLGNPQLLMKVRMAMTMGQFNKDMPPQYLEEIDSLLFQSIWIMLVLFIFNNMIFYVLYLKSRKSGINYMKLLAYSGAVLSFFNIFSPGTSSPLWILTLLIQLGMYIGISFIIWNRDDIVATLKNQGQQN
jgi:hypothetical protein